MSSRTMTGWVGAADWAALMRSKKFSERGFAITPMVQRKKEDAEYWGNENWPPVKVRITVERLT